MAALALLILSIPPVLGGWAGGWTPFLDSLGVGLPLAVGASLLAALLGRGWPRLAALGVLAAGAIPVAQAAWPGRLPEDSADVALVQHNLRFDSGITDLARLERADVATLQEVLVPEALSLPAGWMLHHCPFTRVGGQVVATPHPILETGCAEGIAWVRAALPSGEATIVSLHLHWPWPSRQASQVNALLPVLRALPRPVLLGGDFNQTRWSASLRRIAEATGTRALPALRPSYHVAILPLRIDHVLIPEDWIGTNRIDGYHGSDHAAIRAAAAPA